jgi:hypothetical protein
MMVTLLSGVIRTHAPTLRSDVRASAAPINDAPLGLTATANVSPALPAINPRRETLIFFALRYVMA